MDLEVINNTTFINEIKDKVIKGVFPNLVSDDVRILHKYLMMVLDDIANKFGLIDDNMSLFEDQIRQHNYRDAISLMNSILPFIDDADGKKRASLTNIGDIYTAKEDNIDPSTGSPTYTYTNMMYGRINRNTMKEIPMTEENIDHNYHLFNNTLNMMANKLFVNWVNIKPLDMNSYKETRMYKDTLEAMRIRRDEPDKDFPVKGIYLGDVYDSLTNFVYYDIVRYKWLIFDIALSDMLVPNGILIAEMIDIINCANDIQWERLTQYEQNTFDAQWSSILLNADKQVSIGRLSSSQLMKFIADICFSFDKSYHNMSSAIESGYVRLNKKEEDENETFHEHLRKISKTIPIAHLYEHMRVSYNVLRTSWFESMFFRKDGVLFTPDEYSRNLLTLAEDRDVKFPITPKNAYNFCKSLCFKMVDDSFIPMNRYWRELNETEQETVLQNLFRSIPEKIQWIRLRRQYTNIYSKAISIPMWTHYKEYNDFVGAIYTYMTKATNITDMVFSIMIKKGIYSSFMPIPALTSRSNEDIIDEVSRSLADKQFKSIYSESYYFLTDCRYRDIPPIIMNDNGNIKEMGYFDIASTMRPPWYTMYAMDWVSQLLFFHKFINNRVIMVTGSTGVGKSTQIPKLLLYSLKAINYNTSGSVICSQPRIPPTLSNASRISTELGVPIMRYDPDHKLDLPSNNFYVQYQHSEDSHMKHISSNTLTVSTDGILSANIMNNRMMKRQIESRGKIEYRVENEYDVIIVDEAHEHNTNMDIILTMMRNTLYYNNSIKLVIISATMEADEPIYRRYYRDINDNLAYPNIALLEEADLDRINTDRRLHISPPGMTTRFKVDEIVDKRDPFEIAVEICDSGSGDVLLFQMGTREIRTMVERLNKVLKPHVIALPYHGRLPQYLKDYIEKIDKKLPTLTINKNTSFESLRDLSMVPDPVPAGTYTRAVIVATNVAEASITINTLRYVIDTGMQKIARFDYDARIEILEMVQISESSRVQRKGRVGRVAPGKVYYTYDIENRKTDQLYDIELSDVTEHVIQLLSNDNNPVFADNFDPNKDSFDIKNKGISDDIREILRVQYSRNGKLITYKGIDTQYDYDKAVSYIGYRDGYSSDNVNDVNGDFYIIHPNENTLERNILGKVISTKDDKVITLDSDRLTSKKISMIWNILSEYSMVILIGDKIHKTQFGRNILKLRDEITKVGTIGEMKIRDVIVYVYSRALGCDKEIIAIMSVLNIINKITDACTYMEVGGRMVSNICKIKAMYGDSAGDLISLYNIANAVIGVLKTLPGYFDIISDNIHNIMQMMTDKKRKFINKREIGLNMTKFIARYSRIGIISLRDRIDPTEFTTMIENNILVSMYADIIDDNIDKFNAGISAAHIDTEFGKKIAHNYIRMMNNFFIFDVKYYKKVTLITEVDNMLRDFRTMKRYKLSNNITQAFLFGYGHYVCVKIASTEFYMMVQHPSTDNFVKIKKLNASYHDTFSPSLDMECILFMKHVDGEVSLIARIIPNEVTLPHTYNPDLYRSYKSDTVSDMIDNEMTGIKPYNDQIRAAITVVITNLANKYDDNIWNKLLNLDQSDEYKKMINDRRIKLFDVHHGGGENKLMMNDFISYVCGL